MSTPRILRRGLAICAAAIMLHSGALADAVSVTASRLNVRTGPSVASEAVAMVSRGDTMKYVSQSGGWICVNVNGKQGYVLAEYVNIDTNAIAADVAASQTIWPQTQQGTATAKVNMRSLPMTSAAIVNVLESGTSVTLTGECGNWYVAQYDGKTGYIVQDYVRLGVPGVTPTPAPSGSQSYTQPATGRTIVRVNMRSAASTSSNVLQVLPASVAVTITGEDGNFYKATYGGKTGYIARQYVAITSTADDSSSTSPTQAPYTTPQSATVNTRVNLRADTSTSSRIVKVLSVGSTITVSGESGSWYAVTAGSDTGYVYKQYVTLTGDQPGATTVPMPTPTPQPTPSTPQDSASAAETLYAAGVSAVANVRVNMRSNASATSSIVKVIGLNDSLTAIGEKGDWYKVTYQGSTGYVARQYITITGSQADTVYASWTGVTNTQVNMRRSPNGAVIYVLPASAQVKVTGENGSWYVVNYGGSTGYVASSYISRAADSATATPAPDATATPAPSSTGSTGYVTGTAVNIRSGPGTTYGVVGVVRLGDAVTITAQSGDWYQVTASGLSGYISAKYVSSTQVDPTPTGAPSTDKVINSDWWTGEISTTFKVGMTGTVTDVDTGLSFNIKRTGGINHLDAQPLTAADTAIMKRIYGGTWSWTRRAIWVTVSGKTYAASMNGMPHGDSDSMPDNAFDGCFCIHFLNSRTHTGNRLDALHQAAVAKAYKEGNK